MKILNEYEMSKWAFEQCRKGNDTEEIRDRIISPVWIYCYYMYVNKLQEMKNKVDPKDWEKFIKEVKVIISKDKKDFYMIREIDMTHMVRWEAEYSSNYDFTNFKIKDK